MTTLSFIGNCQAFMLADFYKRVIASDKGDVVRRFDFNLPMTNEDRAFVAKSDIVVIQKVEWPTQIRCNDLQITGRAVEFPQVGISFLWPFGYKDDFKAEEAEDQIDLSGGQPSPQAHGIVQVRRLLQRDRPADQIVDEYVALDFGSIIDLDRFFELAAQKQKQRDAATGFNLMDYIQEALRKDLLFYTPTHFTPYMMKQIVRELFPRLDLSKKEVERVAKLPRTSDVRAGYSYPVHPSIARHFGLTYITDDTKYQFRSGERFTFREYVSRIVKGSFSVKLRQANIKLRTVMNQVGETAETIRFVKEGLADSVGAAGTEAALSRILFSQGDKEESLQALQRAFDLAPEYPDYALHLSIRLVDMRRISEAEEVLVRGLAFSFEDVPLLRHHTFFLQKQLRFAESLVSARQAFQIDPADEHVARMLTHALNVLERYREAEAVAREALSWRPLRAAMHNLLAQALWGQQCFDEAIDAQAAAVDLEPESDWHLDRLHYYRSKTPTLELKSA